MKEERASTESTDRKAPQLVYSRDAEDYSGRKNNEYEEYNSTAWLVNLDDYVDGLAYDLWLTSYRDRYFLYI